MDGKQNIQKMSVDYNNNILFITVHCWVHSHGTLLCDLFDPIIFPAEIVNYYSLVIINFERLGSAFNDLDPRLCHPPLQKNIWGMPDVRPKVHPSIQSTLSHTISTPNRISSILPTSNAIRLQTTFLI